MFFKSCNCNSSIATRVGFAVRRTLFRHLVYSLLVQIIFSLNSMLAWIMKSDLAIRQIEKWSMDYIKMDCSEGKCYGVLAVSSATERRDFPLNNTPGSPHLLCPVAPPSHTQLFAHRS
jgi:hypothetical protein